MTIVKRTVILLIIAIFLFANIGISVLRHICHSSNTTEVRVYPEFSHETCSGCCCIENTPTDRLPIDPDSIHFESVPCCQDVVSYLKPELSFLPAEKHISADIFLISFASPLFLLPESVRKPVIGAMLKHRDHAPPVTGKLLVYFLHQIKIPARFI